MDPLACVSVPAFPLQLLLRSHPDWRGAPAAVVEEDRPQSPVLRVNEQARRAGVRPGMRYAAALALAPGLRAGAVAPSETLEARESLTVRLHRFTPDVEPGEEPGVFWAGLAGLGRLHPSLTRWAEAVLGDLRDAGFHADAVIGFTRFGTYAVAQVSSGVRIFHDPREERAAALDVPLVRLAIDPEVRDTLDKLGVTTVRGLVQLPESGLLERFGIESYRLHRAASGQERAPLRPAADLEPLREQLVLDAPESDLIRCLFLLKQRLDPMLAALAARGEALAGLTMRIKLDRQEWHVERIRPAAPTLDPVQVLDLIRLRLEASGAGARTAEGGITDIVLTAERVPASHEQLRFLNVHPRDLAAGRRALARLRAELGDHAVVRVRVRDGHLPEARIAWEPITALAVPRPVSVPRRTLVRRLFQRPQPIGTAPTDPRHDGWLLLGTAYGSVDELLGPYIVSGGWWVREADRAYHFARTRRGHVLWIYHDRRRRRWFLHGQVE